MSSAISEPADPLVGLSFHDFVIERKLAQGGMGAVYLLRHQRYPIREVLKEPSFGTSGPLGTAEYVAVEQFEHASDVTPAADIWALATVVWEMCTGRRPWSAPNAFALYHKQLHEPPEPPAAGTLSPAWELTLIVPAGMRPKGDARWRQSDLAGTSWSGHLIGASSTRTRVPTARISVRIRVVSERSGVEAGRRTRCCSYARALARQHRLRRTALIVVSAADERPDFTRTTDVEIT